MQILSVKFQKFFLITITIIFCLTEGQNNFGNKIPFLYRLTVFAIAKSLGLITAIIQDAGRTQIEAGNKTLKEAIYFQKNNLSFLNFFAFFFFIFR